MTSDTLTTASPLPSFRNFRGQQEFFPLIHMLRGLASFWVVLFHAETLHMAASWVAMLPEWLDNALFRFGRSGVPIFFVLSGFVITHVVLRTPPDWRGFRRFAIKRAIRLDLPYWAAIAAAIAVYVIIRLEGGDTPPLPSFSNIVAHMFYLQEILDFPAIQVVFWTLTYEVQFYLLTIITWIVIAGRLKSGKAGVFLTVLYGLALLSATLAQAVDFGGIFITYWSGFAAGALAYFYVIGVNRRLTMILLGVLCLALAFPWKTPAELFNIPVLAAAILLVLVGNATAIGTGFMVRSVNALGTLSYSLYLTHYLVLVLVQGLIFRFVPQIHATLATLPIALAIAIMVASLFWLVIERPAQRLANRASAALANRQTGSMEPCSN